MHNDRRWFILGLVVGIGVGLVLWGCFALYFYLLLSW